MNKPCFIAVTNRNLCKRPFFDVIEDLSKKDVKTIVLREKDLSEEEYYEIAEKCKEICDRNGASLTIHNFIDVARRLGIKKIHLPYPVFLKEAGIKELLLRAVNDTEKGLGSFHAVIEDDALEFLADVVNAVKIPVYGIGGINEENITKIMECGAAGGCMMSGFMK